MNEAIGSILPLAIGVAISPLPIITVVLILLSRHARSASVGFLLGWLVGIIVSAAGLALVSSLLPERSSDEGHPLQGVIKLVLGILLLLLALRQWRRRPKKNEEPKLPKWMTSIDSTTFASALGLGLFLSVVNPKNLVLSAHAGLEVTTASLDVSQMVIVLGIFTLLAASTVIIPVLAYLFASDRLRPVLEKLHAWLARENGTIMAVLLLVLGVSAIGKGIALL